VGGIEDFSGQEALMALSEAFLEWEQATQQRAEVKGIEQGQRSLILRLLARRVGEVPEAAQSQIDALSLIQLESLGEALLDFSNLADLEAWLAEQG
jgi:predicted transposase YdaD